MYFDTQFHELLVLPLSFGPLGTKSSSGGLVQARREMDDRWRVGIIVRWQQSLHPNIQTSSMFVYIQLICAKSTLRFASYNFFAYKNSKKG